MRKAQLRSQTILIRVIHGVIRPQAALTQKLADLIISVSRCADAVNQRAALVLRANCQNFGTRRLNG